MPDSETRFAVLLFTDIVGSTELKERHGVPAYSEALRTHNGHFEQIARECRNIRILHNMGDGFFADAGSIAEAVRFALLFQNAMRDGPWGEVRLSTRIGIHAGEVAVVDSEGGSGIVAPAADLAARVMSLAHGGQILLTRFPFDEARYFIREHPLVAGKAVPPLRWLAHGPYLMKGRDEPLEIFEVGAENLAPLIPPADGEKAKRAIRPGEEETLGWRPAVGLEIPGRTGWHLTARLGAGGFGEVWSGEHSKLRQLRAFKFCFDDERLRALKREVTLTRVLRSALGERDDIVHIHELKLDVPPFYLESDLAPHGNLLQWAESFGGLDKIPIEQRISLVAHTATALAAAHSSGVLHKDIKPTNILIFDGPGGEPRPRLVDFGIGTLSDPVVLAQYGVTAAGFTRATVKHSTGTPTYCPPEYLAGRPYTIQGDIFGLGVLLYQLITLKPLEPLAHGWERNIQDPLLREDIAACVDGDPDRRLPNAADLADRLLRLGERRTEIQEKERAAREKSKWLTESQTAIAGALLAVFAGWFGLSLAGSSLVTLSYDMPFIFHSAGAPDELRIVYLEKFDRKLQAELLDKLGEAGAKAVIYDINFDRPWGDPTVDEGFAASIRRFRGVDATGEAVHGMSRRTVLLACGRESINLVRDVGFTRESINQARARTIGERLIPPTDQLLAAADDFGVVLLPQDDFYTVRELSPGTQDEPSITWKAAVALGTKLEESQRLEPRWINYAGPPDDPDALGTFRTCSARNVLDSVAPGYFRDKIVIIGGKPGISGTAAGMDLFATPFHRFDLRGNLPLMSGEELQANVLSNLLHGNWLTRSSHGFDLLLVVIAGALTGAGLTRVRPARGFVAAVSLVVIVTLAGTLTVHYGNVWFPWTVVAFLQVPVALVWSIAARLYSRRFFRQKLGTTLREN